MKKDLVPVSQIAQFIRVLRGQKVILDSELAQLYGVAAKVLNQAVKRELARKFSDLETRVGQQDEEIAAVIDAIRQLLAPPEKPRREIGFHVRETAPRYRTRNHR